jgi:hypothetical protein
MIRLFKSRKAQNTAEYAIMIAIVIGVFSAMQLYVRRGLQARLKKGVDYIPGKITAEAGGNAVNILGDANFIQYEPYYMAKGTSAMTTTSAEGTETGTAVEVGGARQLDNAVTQRTGYQTIRGTNQAD